jgi:hypothetical protein
MKQREKENSNKISELWHNNMWEGSAQIVDKGGGRLKLFKSDKD